MSDKILVYNTVSGKQKAEIDVSEIQDSKLTVKNSDNTVSVTNVDEINIDLDTGLLLSQIDVQKVEIQLDNDKVSELIDGTLVPFTPDTGSGISETNINGAINELDDIKVDKVAGKELSTNDYTNADKNKLDNIEDGAEVNVQSDWDESSSLNDAYIFNKPITITSQQSSDINSNNSHRTTVSGNPHNVTKTEVGLSNVDNTSDLNKPISSATQTALDDKAEKSNVLELDNTTSFTPTNPYEPATKDYVDNASGLTYSAGRGLTLETGNEFVVDETFFIDNDIPFQETGITATNVHDAIIEAYNNGSSLTVKEMDGTPTVIDVTTISFDQDTGLNVTDLGNGEVKISIGSHWKNLIVDGQTTLTPSGEEDLEFLANNGITITTNAISDPKALGFAVNETELNDILIPFQETGMTSTNIHDGIVEAYSNGGEVYTGGTGINIDGANEITTVDNEINHDSLLNYLADEHIDWTQSGVGTIDPSNYVDNDTTYNAGNGLNLEAGDIFVIDEVEFDDSLIPFQETGFTATNVHDAILEASESGVPGGSDTQIQYNNNGIFDGAELYYDNVNDVIKNAELDITDAGAGSGGIDEYALVVNHFDGTGGSTTMTNDGTGTTTWTAVANAQLDTSIKKFGTASLQLDGTGDYIYSNDSSDFTLGSNDWTLDMWVKRNGTGVIDRICGQTSPSVSASHTSVIFLIDAGVIKFSVCSGNTYYSGASTGGVGTDWTHLALERFGNTITIYINGVADGTKDVTGITINDVPYQWAIGRNGEYTDGNEFDGYIDEFRLSNGIARYQGNFTPNNSAYTTSAGYQDLQKGLAITDGANPFRATNLLKTDLGFLGVAGRSEFQGEMYTGSNLNINEDLIVNVDDLIVDSTTGLTTIKEAEITGDLNISDSIITVSTLTSSAIQDAIDNLTNGGLVQLIEGTYICDSTIVIPANITIQGTGQSSTNLDCSTFTTAELFHLNGSYINFKDFTITGVDGLGSYWFVRVIGTSNYFKCNNIEVLYGGKGFLYVNNASYVSTFNVVDNCKFYKQRAPVFNSDVTNGISFLTLANSDLNSNYNGASAIYADRSWSMSVINCRCYFSGIVNGNGVINVLGGGKWSRQTVISGCYIYAGTGAGIKVEHLATYGYNTVISDCQIRASSFGIGLYTESTRVTVSNCIFDCSTYNIYITSVTGTQLNVDDCISVNDTTSIVDYGIYTNGNMVRCQVSNSHFGAGIEALHFDAQTTAGVVSFVNTIFGGAISDPNEVISYIDYDSDGYNINTNLQVDGVINETLVVDEVNNVIKNAEVDVTDAGIITIDLLPKTFTQYKLEDNTNTTEVVNSKGTPQGTIIGYNSEDLHTLDGKITSGFDFSLNSTYINTGIYLDDAVSTTNKMGISLWFKCPSFANRQRLFSSSDDSFYLDVVNSTTFFVQSYAGNYATITIGAMSVDTWYHIYFEYNDISNVYKTYLNNTEIHSKAGVVPRNLEIRLSSSSVTSLDATVVSDFRIFGDSLTSNERGFLYNSGDGTNRSDDGIYQNVIGGLAITDTLQDLHLNNIIVTDKGFLGVAGKTEIQGNLFLNAGMNILPTSIDDTDSPYAQLDSDNIILVDTDTSTAIINLLESSSQVNKVLSIKNKGTSGNNVTVTANGIETIDNLVSQEIYDGSCMKLICDGSAWWII